MSKLEELRKKHVTYDELFDGDGEFIIKDKLSWKIARRIRGLKTFHRNFITGIKSLWYWRKIIWNNRWYDYQYLLDIIEHQMKLMVDPKNKHFTESWHEQVEEIKLSIALLEELRNTHDFEMEQDCFDEFIGSLRGMQKWWD